MERVTSLSEKSPSSLWSCSPSRSFVLLSTVQTLPPLHPTSAPSFSTEGRALWHRLKMPTSSPSARDPSRHAEEPFPLCAWGAAVLEKPTMRAGLLERVPLDWRTHGLDTNLVLHPWLKSSTAAAATTTAILPFFPLSEFPITVCAASREQPQVGVRR